MVLSLTKQRFIFTIMALKIVLIISETSSMKGKKTFLTVTKIIYSWQINMSLKILTFNCRQKLMLYLLWYFVYKIYSLVFYMVYLIEQHVEKIETNLELKYIHLYLFSRNFKTLKSLRVIK